MCKPWFRYYLHSFQFTLHNWKENFRVYYTHFEITGGPCNLIGTNWCNLFLNYTIFCFKSHLFPSQWGGYTKNKTTNQISRFTENNLSNCRKMKDNEYHEANFATFVSKSLIFPPKKWMNLISIQLSTALNWPSPVLWRFQNGCNKVVTEPCVGQFWSKIILMVSNRTHATPLFDFEITHVISAHIALHLVQLPL